jgi:7-cyano-7-deazaguanine synthase
MNDLPAKAVLLLSGGLDSCVLAAWAQARGVEIIGLSFDYGQRHCIELQAAQRIARALGIAHQIVVLDGFNTLIGGSTLTNHALEMPHGHFADESMKATVVPNRNMVMMSIAAAHALALGANCVAIGAHAGDHTIYPDCRASFIEAFAVAVRVGNWNAEAFRVWSPFKDETKAEIVAIGNALRAPMSLTYSCYEGNATHCGKCGTCFERREAFALALIKDETEYQC